MTERTRRARKGYILIKMENKGSPRGDRMGGGTKRTAKEKKKIGYSQGEK